MFQNSAHEKGSFPSGDATMAASTFFMLHHLEYCPLPVAIICTLLVCFARVYFHYHFVIDTLVGALTGSLVAFAVSEIAFTGWYILVAAIIFIMQAKYLKMRQLPLE